MSRVRALIVDDSIVARRILSDILQATPDLEVAGVAATASIGLQKISQVVPDIVLLDVEMPEMDGIEAVARIRASWPKLPVIMCSSMTERGADITLRAIAAGASDYVAKPSSLSPSSGTTAAANGLSSFAADVVEKIRALTNRPERLAGDGLLVNPLPLPRQIVHPKSVPIAAVAIGSSTGGPNALTAIFASLRDLPVPIFVAQHMPPMFTRLLAERLSASSGISVVEARDGDLIEPGHAYVAPGNFHLSLVRDGTLVRASLNQEPPENSCRPAVDVLFRAVARIYGPGTLACVLTGMGQDGTRGAEHIVEVGGTVIVQDAASCVVPSMPSSVAAAVSVDGIYPIDRIGPELAARVRRRTPSTPFVRRPDAVGIQ